MTRSFTLVIGALLPVDLLHAYLSRGDLLHDLRETADQLAKVLSTKEVAARSVKSRPHDRGGRYRLTNRLNDEQVRELVAAFKAGTTRMELAERYGIGRTSVAKC